MLSKSGADFDDGDVTLARRLQPLLIVLARQASLLEQRGRVVTAEGSAAAASLGLTGREVAVLQLLGDGKTAAGIGRQLRISPRTVSVHLDHIYRKLAVRDRLMAVRVAREYGVLPAYAAAQPQLIGQPPGPGDGLTDAPEARARRAFAWSPEVGAVDTVAER